jgi:hypothetical protein
MESLSRVRKNAELRQEVENSRESELTSSVLAPYADRLKRINPDLSSIDTGNKLEEYNALHSKDESDKNSHKPALDPVFHHDLLDEFIDEVKSYNIKKGYSSAEDTDLNILNKAVKTSDSAKEEPHFDDNITQEIKRVISNDFDPQYLEPVNNTQVQNANVLEETAKIHLKLDTVDKELLEMSRSVNSSTKVLNVIVFVLVTVLLFMIGLAVYWILSTQGF